MALVTRSGSGLHLFLFLGVSGCRAPPWIAVYCCGRWLSLHVQEGRHVLNPLVTIYYLRSLLSKFRPLIEKSCIRETLNISMCADSSMKKKKKKKWGGGIPACRRSLNIVRNMLVNSNILRVKQIENIYFKVRYIMVHFAL